MATEIGDQALALSEPKPTVGVYEYRFATGALALTNAAEEANGHHHSGFSHATAKLSVHRHGQ